MLRKLLWLGGIVFLLLILAVGGLMYYADTLAHRAVESAGTRSLGVQTRLGTIHLGLLGGTCTLSELHVDNPEGFAASHFLQVDEGELAVSLASLRGEQIVMPRMELSGLDLHLEQQQGKNNYDVILDHMREQQRARPDDARKKYIIEELVLRDVTVHVETLPVAGDLTQKALLIPEIRLYDVGSDSEGGLLLQELSGTIVQAMLMAVAEQHASLLPRVVAEELKSGLAGLDLEGEGLETVGRILSGTLDEDGQLREEAERLLDDAGKTIKGFGDLLRQGDEPQPSEER